MKKIIKLSEEIIPLSRQQLFLGLILISCFFQFALFYSPALAQEAMRLVDGVDEVANSEEKIAFTISLNKSDNKAGIENRASAKTNLLAKFNQAISSVSVVSNNVPEKINRALINDLNIVKDEASNDGRKIALLSKPEDIEMKSEIKVTRSSFHTLTAYNSEAAQTDDSPCITANGFDVCAHGIEDTIAANFLKFGTKVRIPELFGDRIFIVRDRMNKRYPDRVDVWFLSKSEARQFGVRHATIEVIEIIEPEIIENNTQFLLSRR